MTRRQFEALVERALRRLPRPFREKLANLAVVVEDWPDDETLDEMGIEPPDTLYGLYRGVDITHRDTSYGNVLPDTVTIYQGPIEEDCAGEADMADLVRETVIHEIGHYFGLDDETMESLDIGGSEPPLPPLPPTGGESIEWRGRSPRSKETDP
jgi:predicted Zn-dependent protease with MMP-like domain